MSDPKTPNPVDTHVGRRIRQRRWLLGQTQQQLATAIGIKFQQVQKYETGANRVSASRLWDIAAALGVPVRFFFEGLGDEAEPPQPLAPEEARLLAAYRSMDAAGQNAVLLAASRMATPEHAMAAE